MSDERAALVRAWQRWDTYSRKPERARIALLKTDRTAHQLVHALNAYAQAIEANPLDLRRQAEHNIRAGIHIAEALPRPHSAPTTTSLA